MKPRRAAALALVLLAACGPDMATINRANDQAEHSAEGAQAAQLQAEHSAEFAAQSAMKTQDQEQAMCGACDSCHVLTGTAAQRHEVFEASWYEACDRHPWPFPIFPFPINGRSK
jgi:hypothetical protein